MTRLTALALLLMSTIACVAPAGRSAATTAVSSDNPGAAKTLTVIMRVEPATMMEGAVDRSAIHKPAFAATLGAWDLQENPYPVLAEAVPVLNTATWQVEPDGRMETTYRLRSGLTWHDGKPITAEDVAFSRRAEMARVEFGMTQTSAEIRLMDDIRALDERTLTISWRGPFSEAAAPDLIPYPRSILEPALAAGAEVFSNHAYWSTEFVGAGPYRMERWERGAFIEGAAFDGYALGGPKIARIRLTWGNDPTVNLTRLLAGDAEIALDGAIRFEQASILRQRWGADSGGSILLNPTSLRYIQVQARPEYVSPRALLDGRARRALSHSVDRVTLAETMLEDRSMVADTVPPPVVPYYRDLDAAIAKYPFDPRRAEQLLGELGYTRGADGVLVNAGQERFRLEVRGVSGGQEEQDTTIVTGNFRDRGMDAYITLLPSSTRAVDDKVKGTFSGLTLNNNTLQRGLGLQKWLTTNIGGDHDAWTGGNRMGWSYPEFDRVYDQMVGTLDRPAANRLMIDLMKILADENPSPPLYYNFQVVAHVSALRGPQPITPDSTRYGNMHTWTWQ